MEREPSLERQVPKVEITSTGDILNIEGLQLGFVETNETNNLIFIKNLLIEEPFRGKGFGKSVYLNLIKKAQNEGKVLCSGEELSRQALRVWEWLVKNNLAK